MLQSGCHAFTDPENGMAVAQGWRKVVIGKFMFNRYNYWERGKNSGDKW